MCVILPCHAEALPIAKIGNFQTSICREQQVFWLQITVRNTHLVHVLDAAHHLLEEAVGLDDFQFTGGQHKRI